MEANAKQIEDMARKADRELAAEEVAKAYNEHMYQEAADRNYDFAAGKVARERYYALAKIFRDKYGVEWSAL